MTRAPGVSERDLETALEQSEARFQALVHRAGFGLFRASADGRRLLEVNEALMHMLGYEDEAPLLEVDLAELCVDPGEHAQVMNRAATPDFFEWIEISLKKRDASPILVRVAVRAVSGAEGRVTGFEGIAEDITERRRQEELLRRSERMASIGTTVAGVAHELNNPLAAIMGFTQLLLTKDPRPDERSALEIISHEAERSARIVKDLLFLAHKREEERRTPVNLNDVVGYIVRTRRYALETSGIACELRLAPSLPLVCADRAQIEQVVLNLLSNAEHALRSSTVSTADGDAAPRITLRTRRHDNSVVLEVEDNGPGIPETERDSIWDPFWTTRDGEGTGLGLSVVRHIVDEHGGSIVADPVSPNGACFRVSLPVMAPGTSTAAAEGPATHPLDVLLLASDPEDRRFLTRFLSSRGHAALVAANLERAKRLAEHTTFDAVVLDAETADRAAEAVGTLRGVSGCANARFAIVGQPGSGAAHVPPGTMLLSRPYDVELLRRAIEDG